jgi:hypothetical protein
LQKFAVEGFSQVCEGGVEAVVPCLVVFDVVSGAFEDGGEELGVVGGEPAHEEVGGLDLFLLLALHAVAEDGDEGFAGLGDAEDGLEDDLVALGEAAVLEGVEVAFGRAGASARAAALLAEGVDGLPRARGCPPLSAIGLQL